MESKTDMFNKKKKKDVFTKGNHSNREQEGEM